MFGVCFHRSVSPIILQELVLVPVSNTFTELKRGVSCYLDSESAALQHKKENFSHSSIPPE